MSRRTGKVLMVDDEVDLLEMAGRVLTLEGHSVTSASTAEEALQLLERDRFDVVLLDLRLPGMSGMELLQVLRPTTRPEEVIVLTAYAEVQSAVAAMKAGAYGYVAKPFDADTILAEIGKILEVKELRAENRALRGQQHKGPEALVGEHATMQRLRAHIREVASTPLAVLIRGETGTGKELVAEAIHAVSNRAQEPLVKCNCAAFAQGLLESELFGHVKGAFTGAARDRAGRFEEADGGTLFLDEIGDLPVEAQIRLLRVLQEHEFEPVGSTQTRRVDVRVVTATHQDLDAAIQDGRFREDLYYRLNGMSLAVPPLRERSGDVPLLCRHILERCKATLAHEIRGISAGALDALERYPWPGNVRELENVLQAAAVLARGTEIDAQHVLTLLHARDAEQDEGADRWLCPISAEEFHGAREEFEVQLINRALRLAEGNIARAARMLHLERRTLQRKIRTYRIEVKAFRPM